MLDCWPFLPKCQRKSYQPFIPHCFCFNTVVHSASFFKAGKFVFQLFNSIQSLVAARHNPHPLAPPCCFLWPLLIHSLHWQSSDVRRLWRVLQLCVLMVMAGFRVIVLWSVCLVCVSSFATAAAATSHNAHACNAWYGLFRFRLRQLFFFSTLCEEIALIDVILFYVTAHSVHMYSVISLDSSLRACIFRIFILGLWSVMYVDCLVLVTLVFWRRRML